MDYSSRLPNELPFFIRIRGFAEYGIYSRMDSNAPKSTMMRPTLSLSTIPSAEVDKRVATISNVEYYYEYYAWQW